MDQEIYFAWVGGQNAPQQALNTTGTISAVGEVTITNVDGQSDLTSGATYTINGPNILPGASFVAQPGSALTMDQPSTGFGTDLPLMIIGPIVENAPFDVATMLRHDEQILSLQIDQREGDAAALTITIPNPEVGLLSPDRQQWCWVSDDDGPLFNGRLFGVFEDLSGETVKLKLLAKPKDYTARKLALATGMAKLPEYDAVFQPTQPGAPLDPDRVLEGYSSLFHIHRVTLDVTASDVLEGEDGTLSFGPAQRVLYDDLSVRFGQPPLLQCDVDATVGWTQHGDGTVDFTGPLHGAFVAAASTGYTGRWISSLTGDGLYSSWPKPGATLGNGWTLSMDSQISPATFAPQDRFTPGYEDAGQMTNQPMVQPYTFTVKYFKPQPLFDRGAAALREYATNPNGLVSVALQTGDGPNIDTDEFTSTYFDPLSRGTPVEARFSLWTYRLDRFAASYVAGRSRSEQLRFSVLADIQAVDPSGSEPGKVSVTSNQVGEAIDAGFTIPIGDTRRNSYFQTDRGLLSYQYLLLLARAKLRSRSRAAEIEFTVPWAVGREITCRHSVTIADDRIPGGSATGKVIAYSLMADPSGGQRVRITIGCAVGNGGSVEAAAGIGAWADDGVVEPDVQVLVGAQISPVPGEIWAGSLLDFDVVDADGINLLDLQGSVSRLATFTVENGLKAQCQVAAGSGGTAFEGISSDPIARVKSVPTKVTAQFVAIGSGAFHASLDPGVSPLKIPKGIDLAA